MLSRVEDKQSGKAARVIRLADDRIAIIVEGEDIIPLSVSEFLMVAEAVRKAKTELLRV